MRMKKCPYCGVEYPDEASVCAIDGERLQGIARGEPALASVPQPERAETEAEAIESTPLTETDSETDTPAGFRGLGLFEAFEADRLLKQFLEADIRFQIARIERRERSGAASYRTVGLIGDFHPLGRL